MLIDVKFLLQDSLIVTKDDDGNALAPQLWEFLRCTNLDGQAPPPGYTAPPNGLSKSHYFGILRPNNARTHCLALESENDTSTNARNSIVDSTCTDVPQEYRTFMIEETPQGAILYYAAQETSLVISGTGHAELQFFSNIAKGSPQQLMLVEPYTSD